MKISYLFILSVEAVIPPLPELDSFLMSKSCKHNDKKDMAVQFVRTIKYVTVLKDYIQQCNENIKNAVFHLNSLSLQINGVQDLIAIDQGRIKDLDSKISVQKKEIKTIQAQMPDVKSLGHKIVCNVKFAPILIQSLSGALGTIKTVKDGDSETDWFDPGDKIGGFTEKQYKNYQDALDQLRKCESDQSYFEKSKTTYDGLYSKFMNAFGDATSLLKLKKPSEEIYEWYAVSDIKDWVQSFTDSISTVGSELSQLKVEVKSVHTRIQKELDIIKGYAKKMQDYHTDMIDHQNRINEYQKKIEDQKKIIAANAQNIADSKTKIESLVTEIKAVDSAIYKACPNWLQLAL